MNESGEPNMGRPSVRFEEEREGAGHWRQRLSTQPLLPTLPNHELAAQDPRCGLGPPAWRLFSSALFLRPWLSRRRNAVKSERESGQPRIRENHRAAGEGAIGQHNPARHRLQQIRAGQHTISLVAVAAERELKLAFDQSGTERGPRKGAGDRQGAVDQQAAGVPSQPRR